MRDFISKITPILNKVNYFDKTNMYYKNIKIAKPDAVIFDWENTIIKRKNPYLLNFRELPFELTDRKIIEFLELLKKHKIYTAIISNREKYRLFDEMNKSNLYKYFDKVIGSGDYIEPKPSIEPMIRALVGSSVEFGENIWMIGDSQTDMEFSRISLATGILFAPNDHSKEKERQNTIHALRIQNYQEIIDIIKYFYESK